MTTLIKIIVTSLLSLSFLSCNFDLNMGSGVSGNGNVITQERNINESFSAIKATEGLDVYITQSETESITVEADENLHDLILTEIIDGVLIIHAKENIGNASSKKIIIRFKHISSIISTSGSDVYSTNTINADELHLKSTSGSDMTLAVNTKSLNCKSTSGSDLRLSGKTLNLVAEATSGSDIEAADLMAESSQVKATSGADITVNTSKKLMANANSGGDIKYYGNPESVERNDSASGSIKQK